MIRIIACGQMKQRWMSEGLAEYMKRIRPYEKIELVEVKDEMAPESNSPAENAQVIAKEGERLLKQIKDSDWVILLDLAGREWDSETLAYHLQDLYNRSRNHIDFVIGGSLGVSPALIARADDRWKLSDCTFPHQLCRVMVAEQIYRSFRILHHEPYHK